MEHEASAFLVLCTGDSGNQDWSPRNLLSLDLTHLFVFEGKPKGSHPFRGFAHSETPAWLQTVRFPVPEVGDDQTDMSKVHKARSLGDSMQTCRAVPYFLSSTTSGCPSIPGATFPCTTSASWALPARCLPLVRRYNLDDAEFREAESAALCGCEFRDSDGQQPHKLVGGQNAAGKCRSNETSNHTHLEGCQIGAA